MKLRFQRIRDLREDLDMTQNEMAQVLGLTQRSYAYYENGDRTIPPELLIKIADFHNISLDYLLGRSNIK